MNLCFSRRSGAGRETFEAGQFEPLTIQQNMYVQVRNRVRVAAGWRRCVAVVKNDDAVPGVIGMYKKARVGRRHRCRGGSAIKSRFIL